jgi:outer membrane protein OmpA-like peptidoglycan-associated protein
MAKVRSYVTAALVVAFPVGLLGGCSGMSHRERGAVIGAAAGAAGGAVVGKHMGSTAKGAIVGAALGGAAGAIIGHQMDQQAKELEVQVAGASVERVGEGIQVTFDSGILFDFDSDRLRPAAQQNLGSLASSLQRYPKTDLLVVGHTDSVGAEDYNQRLSERRAASAANYLISQGVDYRRIRLVGLGETEPVASNATDAGRQLNRRVEVAIYANEELRNEAVSQAGMR